MLSVGSTGSNLRALLLSLAFVVGSALYGCTPHPQPKRVSVQWQALLVYHPLWEAQEMNIEMHEQATSAEVPIPSVFALPAMSLQPIQTPAGERRRQMVAQSAAMQQQALMTRLQKMETRRLQEEMEQLRVQQRTKEELARQEMHLWAEREVQDALREHYLPQMSSEIQRQSLRRLWRLRPDLRDYLRPRIEQVELLQQQLAETLVQRLQSIEQETARRLREQEEQIASGFQRQREELQQQSQQRFQAEQVRVGQMIRPFAGNGESRFLPPVTKRVPTTFTRHRSISPPTTQLSPLLEQEVKQWVEAICRKHGWVPVWQGAADLPDVTAQIAREMQGTAL